MTRVAVIVLDSLRTDRFREQFDFVSGRRFTDAYSTSHWTIPAHASLLTGRYPSEVGVHAKSQSLTCDRPTLTEILQERGVETRWYSANANVTFWGGWDRGFDQFLGPSRIDPRLEGPVDWTSFGREAYPNPLVRPLQGVGKALRADGPTLAALRQGYRYYTRPDADGGAGGILRRLEATEFDDESFLLLNIMETHTPYHPPDGGDAVRVDIGDAFSENVTDPERIRVAYDTSTSYLASVYRDIYRLLVERFDLVLTLSDHGEVLGEHGMWNHGYGLYPELTRIPLVISGPDVTAETVSTPVNLLDIHRTVLEAFDRDAPSRGRDLLGSLTPRPLLTEYHGFTALHRNLFERKGVDMATYEDHDTPMDGVVLADGDYCYRTHDDGETVTVTPDGDADEGQAETAIDDLLSDIDRRPIGTSAETDVDEEVMSNLEDLGYA